MANLTPIKLFKQKLLDNLYEPYKKCMQCPLGTQGRLSIVFGQGNPDAKILIIGEAPGKTEDQQGNPFMGRAGKVLNTTLELCSIQRSDVYITNIVKCRPPKNRPPLLIESTICKNLLLFNQIKIINPSVIITLGTTALQAFFEKPIKISLQRGTLLHFDNFIIVPTYHPAYILRNQQYHQLLQQDFQKAIQLMLKASDSK